MAEIIPIAPRRRTEPERLWRDALGRELRDLRAARRQTLVETAELAGISPQYLSEIERGLKEPSSEMISAVAGALDSSLVDLTSSVSEQLRRTAPDRSAHLLLAA